MTPETIQELTKPLDGKHVAHRSQSGRSLSYLEGWHIIAEANRIFGFDGWTRETIEMKEMRPPELVKSSAGKETWRVGFLAKVRVTVGNAIREGTGFGSGALPDLGEAYESAIKEAETDAMKRAFMTFGNPFGLALYDKTQANVSKEGEQREPQKAGTISAAEQKRGLVTIENELLDCASVVAVDKCADGWKFIAKRDGWSKDYQIEAAKKFQARREAVIAALPDLIRATPAGHKAYAEANAPNSYATAKDSPYAPLGQGRA